MTDWPLFTRRTAITGAAGLGAALGVAGLAGCGPGGGGRAQEAPAWEPGPAGPPRRGGRIRVAGVSSSTADTFDPAKGALSTDYVRHNMLYSGLTQFDARLTPQLALAEVHREPGSGQLDDPPAQGRGVPRRLQPDRGRRGLFADAP